METAKTRRTSSAGQRHLRRHPPWLLLCFQGLTPRAVSTLGVAAQHAPAKAGSFIRDFPLRGEKPRTLPFPDETEFTRLKRLMQPIAPKIVLNDHAILPRCCRSPLSLFLTENGKLSPPCCRYWKSTRHLVLVARIGWWSALQASDVEGASKEGSLLVHCEYLGNLGKLQICVPLMCS